jgi:2'-5' RNA ligase
MLALTTLLCDPEAERINSIIKSLETKFGLDDVQATLDPHLTYQLAAVKHLDGLKDALIAVAQGTAPFVAHATGLGVFPGPQPVIYIPVLRTDALNDLHRRIRLATAPLCSQTDRYSAPDLWLPHISLALHDTTPELLGPVLMYLNEETYNLTFSIYNLAILRQQGELFVREQVFAMDGDLCGSAKLP